MDDMDKSQNSGNLIAVAVGVVVMVILILIYLM